MEVLALLTIILLTVGFYRFLFTRFLFHGVDYGCCFSSPEAFEGREILLVETVHNNKLLPVHWLKAEIHTSKWLDFAGTRSVIAQEARFVTSGYFLAGYQKTVRSWKVKCLKRGVYAIPNVTLAGGDFLGGGTQSVPVEVNARLVVYPGTVDLEEQLVPVSLLQGDTVVRRWMMEDPFLVSGVREYTGYEPMNSIHWLATARTGEWMVRKNDYTTERSVRVILNIQSREYEYLETSDPEPVELGIKAAAALFERALGEGIPAGLASNGWVRENGGQPVFTPIASGRNHARELLTLLAGLQLKKSMEFEDFIREVAGRDCSSEMVILTAYLSEGLYRRIAELKRPDNCLKIILVGGETPQIPYRTDVELFRLPVKGGDRCA